MTITTQTTTTAARPRNLSLIAARVVAGVIGALQLAGVSYFAFIAPEEATWLGWAIDIPVLAILFGGILLKLVTALVPGLSEQRRIKVGLTAVGLSTVASLLKIPLYGEPEGVTFLAVDAVLLTFLLLARRRNG